VATLTIVSLLPFITKAFNMDEPLFVWAARQIQYNPLDFYGFKVNWYGFEMDMFSVNKNPPFVSYYIALITGIFGWSEPVIHFFFLIPALGLSLGTYFLARSICSLPHLAAILTVFSPVFLVSSASVMSDTTMLAFYVWAIFLWLEGLKKESFPHLFLSAIFIALSTLTKYFGATLIPLLLVFTLVEKKFDYRLCILFIPELFIVGYEWLTYSLYDQSLISDAAAYAAGSWVRPEQFLDKTLTGLSFTGGCLLGITFFAPILWSRRTLLIMSAVLLILSFSVLLSVNTIGGVQLYDELESSGFKSGMRWGLIFQLTLFISAGMHILILSATDLMKNRDATSILLFLWIMGAFIFSSYINWTTSARNIFPMLPVAAILVIRRINYSNEESNTAIPRNAIWPLLPAVLISILVTWADVSLANSQRSAANTIYAKLKNYQYPVKFQGHWGFQYYMEELGYEAVDFRTEHSEGDIMIIPRNQSNTVWPQNNQARWPQGDRFIPIEKFQEQILRGLSVMRLGRAGFYSSQAGPLPFAIGEVTPEEYIIFQAK
jgi:4-amino-4-deoxy-L-arabinose transferase-like glycosyltransferase